MNSELHSRNSQAPRTVGQGLLCKNGINMKLMSNTAASYPMGAGRFEPWLFVNCYRVRGVVSDWLIYRCG